MVGSFTLSAIGRKVTHMAVPEEKRMPLKAPAAFRPSPPPPAGPKRKTVSAAQLIPLDGTDEPLFKNF